MNATANPAMSAGSMNGRMDPAWMLMLRGAIAIVFGVLALVWPDLTLLLLVGLFAAYALLNGFVAVVAAFRGRDSDSKWWLPLLLGIVSIVAGICAIVYPGLTALVLVLVMGANAIVTGALDIAIAARLRRVLRGHWMLIVSGIVSIVFGVLVFAYPGAGALALVWLISLYAVVTGVLLFALGLRTRRAGDSATAPRAAAAGGR
jgi:uncharacterized membrane protein HdeD (DUF308 family)